ncbi:uncharacterized protein DSM5745_02579 [Aspergillus mulundensis]|uniref:DUF7726 domain-containing protein n=1 Tax=Aspergillus mulundensis TaxID=1810919 RepID=A0A3D8SWZ8_9EURO|nr:hypothetical protein DSM5745_02579 [Aspergillus mulundensis]RDW90804.1 hypothetical protein DSM5745_02579 [Aspergillus mulundensis]
MPQLRNAEEHAWPKFDKESRARDRKLQKAIRETGFCGLLTVDVCKKLIAGEELTEEEFPARMNRRLNGRGPVSLAGGEISESESENADADAGAGASASASASTRTTRGRSRQPLQEKNANASKKRGAAGGVSGGKRARVELERENKDEQEEQRQQLRRSPEYLRQFRQEVEAQIGRESEHAKGKRARLESDQEQEQDDEEQDSDLTSDLDSAHEQEQEDEEQDSDSDAASDSGTESESELDYTSTTNYDVSTIYLDGEDEGDVPVYDTCDVIRHKIQTFLDHTSCKKAAFLREISKCLPNQNNGKPMTTGPLTSFMAKSGSTDGNQSSVFYAAYVFFEKLRVRDGKRKTAFRKDMEDVWGYEGFDRKTSKSQVFIVRVGKELYRDEYGKIFSM